MKYRYFEKEPGFAGTVRDLFSRKYLYREALKGVSFNIDSPEIVGLIGPNGAGKTTCLKILSGIIKPTDGSADVLGYNPYEKKNDFKKKLAFLMGNKNQAYLNLPAIESFNSSRIIYDIDRTKFKQQVKQLTEMLDIAGKINVPVRNLSFGERMKVEFILALLHEPEIVFLDEPTIGMDIIAQYNLRKYIHDYFSLRKNATFIITSHNMTDIEDLCSRIIIIRDGKFIYDGEKRNLANTGKKIEVYFNKAPEQGETAILEKLNYIRINDIHFQKTADFSQFQNDWNSTLSRMNIRDMSFTEPDFEKIIGEYLKTGN